MCKLPAKESLTSGPAPATATRETLRHRRDHRRGRRLLVGQTIARKASKFCAVIFRGDSKAAMKHDPTFTIDEGHEGQGREEGRRGEWAMIEFQICTQPGTSAVKLSKAIGLKSMSGQSITNKGFL